MPSNTATILGGPALVKFRGATFYSKGDITLNHARTTFPIATDRFGKVDERVSDEELKVSFEPVGEWESLSVLFPYAATLLGSLITPYSQAASAVTSGSDTVTVTAHGLVDGDDVLVHMATGGTLPGGLSSTTRYFVKAVDADNLKFYPTAADVTANTNVVDITDAGTGTLYVDRDFPLIIHTFAGVKLTLYNAAVVKMPTIVLSSVKSLLGAITFEAFLRNGADWSTAGSRWAIANEALADTSFAPANVITQAYAAAWGNAAPWSSFETKEGWTIDFNEAFEAVMTDRLRTLTRRLTSLDVSAKAIPAGIDESQMLTKLLLQGNGAVAGRSLSGDDLSISATGVYVRLYGAALKASSQHFSVGKERMGELSWVATRTFAAGAPNPLFFVGSASP